MTGMMLWAVMLFLPPQQGDSAAIDQWLRDLASPREEVRRGAVLGLRRAGPAADGLLHDSRRQAESEVAQAIQRILDFRDVDRNAPESLRKSVPAVAERLSEGGLHAWTELFMENVEPKDGKRRFPELSREALAYLASRAVRGAKGDEEKENLCYWVGKQLLTESGPGLAELLRQESREIRLAALRTLGQVGAREARPQVLGLLQDADPDVRRQAAEVFGPWCDGEGVLALAPLLREGKPEVRAAACRALGLSTTADGVDLLMKSLGDSDAAVRIEAATALCRWGRREGVPPLLEAAVQDPETSLNCLNGVREPKVWKRLKETPSKKEEVILEQKTLRELLEAVSGLRVVPSADFRDLGTAVEERRSVRFVPHQARTVLGDVETFGGASRGKLRFAYLLEPDHLVLMLQSESIEFWRKWWDSLPK